MDEIREVLKLEEENSKLQYCLPDPRILKLTGKLVVLKDNGEERILKDRGYYKDTIIVETDYTEKAETIDEFINLIEQNCLVINKRFYKDKEVHKILED